MSVKYGLCEIGLIRLRGGLHIKMVKLTENELEPPEGSKCLYALWKQLPGCRSQPDQPRTPWNNYVPALTFERTLAQLLYLQFEPASSGQTMPPSEVIGRMKMRARILRGYKTWQGMEYWPPTGWKPHPPDYLMIGIPLCFTNF